MMLLDYNSLLLAIVFSASCLTITSFVAWLSSRSDGFMLTWAAGGAFLVADAFIYSLYVLNPHPLTAAVSLDLLMVGLAILFGAAEQFRTGHLAVPVVAAIAIVSSATVTVPIALGYDGVGFLAENTWAMVLLVATGVEYWKGRDEAPVPIIGMAVLYGLVGLSFGLCGVLIARDGQFVIGHAPDNWAEDLSLIVSIVGLSGIGALSLAVNQWRIARTHRHDAETDPLTGLLNRRAIFEAYGRNPLKAETAIVVFDLDCFKDVNDHYGHAIGDEVLCRFAATVRENTREGDLAARIGGEEFALVLPDSTRERALFVAERIRSAFAVEEIATEKGGLRCTVSAGASYASRDGQDFSGTLNLADKALYQAKNAGRNQVIAPALKRAS